MSPKLVIIRGLPGSGKSTTAKHFAHDGYKHYEADMYFERSGVYQFNPARLQEAHNWCQTSAATALYNGNPVVVSNTFTTFKEVQPYLNLITSPDDLHVITCTDYYGSIHDVPDHTVARMQARMLNHRHFLAKCIVYLEERNVLPLQTPSTSPVC